MVEVRAMPATSSPASRTEVAMYFAAEPKPGQVSVAGRSLSTVFGIPMQRSGRRRRAASCATFRAVSWESPPPL